MKAWLTYTDNPEEPALILDEAQTTRYLIGNDPQQCDLLVEHESVSSTEVQITEEEGSWIAESLGEEPHASLNGQALELPIHLKEGDLLQVGETALHFSIPTEATQESETIEESEEMQEPPHEKMPIEESDDDIFSSAVSQEGSSTFDQSFSSPQTPGVSASRWLFKVLTGPNSGAQITLEDDRDYIVGSDAENCDIVLTDLSVSKQHMKISLNHSGEMVFEDLGSRNGVLINGEKIEEPATHTASAVVSAGATTFMVVDRHAEQKTIVTPSLSTAQEKILEAEEEEEPKEEAPKKEDTYSEELVGARMHEQSSKTGSRIAGLVFACLFLIIGMGLFMLFDEEDIVDRKTSPDHIQALTTVLEEYPYFEYEYNDVNGVLVLAGHILTQNDKKHLISRLSHLDFIGSIDDTNLVIDEIVWQQFNLILSKGWRGISLSGKIPGEFILSGTLETQNQSEGLNNYLKVNFPYNNRLENQVVVEEQLIASINDRLQEIAPNELLAELSNGELVLVGTVPPPRVDELELLMEQLKNTPGVNTIRNLVIEQTGNGESGVIDISDTYLVTGFSKASEANSSVIINGRILERGDELDGMTIVSIRPRAVILEKDGIKYRINYNP